MDELRPENVRRHAEPLKSGLAFWRFTRALLERRAGLFSALLAAALVAPSLGDGFSLDDVPQSLRVRGVSIPGVPASSLDLFSFVPEGAVGERQRDYGLVPWWAADSFHFEFWRPLSSLTHFVDYKLWPHRPWLMHLQNILWLVVLVLATSALCKRLVQPAWAAGLATLLFALEDGHGVATGWIANRNVIIAATAGTLALLAHDRWRRDGWRAGALWGPVAFAAGLAASEAGTATLGYLVAHAAFLEAGPLKNRLRGLAPYLVIVVAWRIAYRTLGYGIAASGVYVDPFLAPGSFLDAVATRLPLFAATQLGPLSADLWLFAPSHLTGLLVVVAAGFLGWCAVAFWPLLRGDRVARFGAAGLLVSCVPICSSLPSDRLLFFGVGASLLIAGQAVLLLGKHAVRPTSRAWRIAAFSLAAVWLVNFAIISPVALPVRARVAGGVGRGLAAAAASVPSDPALARQTLVIVNAPDLFIGDCLPPWLVASGRPVPARLRLLGVARGPLTLRRLDARALEAHVDGGYLAHPLDTLDRGPELPMPAGAVITRPGLRIHVLRVTADGRPETVIFRFDVPLEDPSLRWLIWSDGAYLPFHVPAIGSSIALPALQPWGSYRQARGAAGAR